MQNPLDSVDPPFPIGEKVTPNPTPSVDLTPVEGKPGFFLDSKGKLHYIPEPEQLDLWNYRMQNP